MIDAPHPTEPDASSVSTCLSCGAAMAADQRWCLHCGNRRSDLASPFDALPAARPAPPPTVPIAAAVVPPERRSPWLGGALAVGAAGVLFVVGLLAGSAGDPPRTTVNVPAAKAPVVNVSVPAAAAAPADATADTVLTSDWPAGKDGWTVQLQSLPADGTPLTDVTAATAAATGKGAADVGALPSDDYASLPSGRFIVYSGVYATKTKAQQALRRLKADFPKAKVVEVSASGDDDEPAAAVSKSDLKKQSDLSPEQFQKQSKKLPDKLQTEGAPPAKDDKPAGGGSAGTSIG